MLSTFAVSIVEQARSEIADTAIRTEIRQLEGKLVGAIKQTTSWHTAISTNLVAWLLSIAITFLIVVAGIPTWITSLITKTQSN